MKRVVRLGLALALFSPLSLATVWAGQQTGQVTRLTTRASDGLVYFFLDGTYASRPACATQGYWMIKDENSAAGKRQIAALLAARATGAQVTVYGFNACTRWSDGEDVNEILY